MLRPYIKLLISEMKLRVLDIDILLIQVGITDGRRAILHYISSLEKPSKMADRTQDIEC